MGEPALPPLPQPNICTRSHCGVPPFYSEAQMTAYALQAVAAERERAASIIHDHMAAFCSIRETHMIALSELQSCLDKIYPGYFEAPVYQSASGDALDAARYRWLRDKAKRTQARNWGRLHKGEILVLQCNARDESDILHGASLDAAVDAAIRAEGE